MVVVDSERTTIDGKSGRLYTVTVKTKFPAEIGPFDADLVAGRRGKAQVALGERELRPRDMKVIDVRRTNAGKYDMYAEYEVEVFRPYE